MNGMFLVKSHHWWHHFKFILGQYTVLSTASSQGPENGIKLSHYFHLFLYVHWFLRINIFRCNLMLNFAWFLTHLLRNLSFPWNILVCFTLGKLKVFSSLRSEKWGPEEYFRPHILTRGGGAKNLASCFHFIPIHFLLSIIFFGGLGDTCTP